MPFEQQEPAEWHLKGIKADFVQASEKPYLPAKIEFQFILRSWLEVKSSSSNLHVIYRDTHCAFSTVNTIWTAFDLLQHLQEHIIVSEEGWEKKTQF